MTAVSCLTPDLHHHNYPFSIIHPMSTKAKSKKPLSPDRAILAELKALDKAERKIIQDDVREDIRRCREIDAIRRLQAASEKAVAKALARITARRSRLQARLSARA